EDNVAQLDAEGRANLGRVRAAAQRMAHLIDALLSLASVGRAEVHREAVSLTLVVRGIGGRLRGAHAARDVELLVPEGLVAEGDARLLEAIMENLLANAWKFTSQRAAARIEVGVTTKERDAPVYFVRDNGAGFDMAYASKLFGAFQRLHATTEFPGTGIGLATVQRAVRRHGGEIWAEGAVDRGATFFFTLDRGMRS
ncbi:MAG TPA: ATP-binding protein, partial [Labilithrix sp.]|nr:ATP-binding protein [Labilithrix sp.]